MGNRDYASNPRKWISQGRERLTLNVNRSWFQFWKSKSYVQVLHVHRDFPRLKCWVGFCDGDIRVHSFED